MEMRFEVNEVRNLDDGSIWASIQTAGLMPVNSIVSEAVEC